MRNLNNEKHKNKSFISELYVVYFFGFQIIMNTSLLRSCLLVLSLGRLDISPRGSFHDAKILHFRGDSKVFPHGVTLKNVNLEILVIRYKNTAI